MPWEGFTLVKPAVFGLFRPYSDSDFVFIKAQGRDANTPEAKQELGLHATLTAAAPKPKAVFP